MRSSVYNRTFTLWLSQGNGELCRKKLKRGEERTASLGNSIVDLVSIYHCCGRLCLVHFVQDISIYSVK